MHLFLRQGSASQDLDMLLPLVRPANMDSLSLCTDDLSCRDLCELGHLDRLVSKLVRSKVPLSRALRLATRNPAVYFNLSDRNALVPGRKADLVVFDNPEEMRVRATVKDGKVVYKEGSDIGAGKETPTGPGYLATQFSAAEQGRPAEDSNGKKDARYRRPRRHDRYGGPCCRCVD